MVSVKKEDYQKRKEDRQCLMLKVIVAIPGMILLWVCLISSMIYKMSPGMLIGDRIAWVVMLVFTGIATIVGAIAMVEKARKLRR